MNEGELPAALCNLTAFKVRRVSFQQTRTFGALFGVHNDEVIRRHLRRLVAAGRLVEHENCLAKETPELPGPLHSWPEDGEPNFSTLSWQLMRRWEHAPLVPMRIYSASTKTLRALGGVIKAELKTKSQLSHDLGVTAAYLRLLEESPALARAWVNEDELEKTYEKGEPRPDAVIFNNNRPVLAVEFGGGYSREKLHEQWRGAVRRKIAWDLW